MAKKKEVECPKCGETCDNNYDDIDEMFGYRSKTDKGDPKPQSWCKGCRRKENYGNADQVFGPASGYETVAKKAEREAGEKIKLALKPRSQGVSTYSQIRSEGGFHNFTNEQLKVLWARHYPNDKQTRSRGRMIQRLTAKFKEKKSK